MAQVHADETVVILRHGEKPALGLGQLSCQGLNRSLALPAVLLARYGTPSEIYAPNPAIKKKDKGVAYAYIRPLATIEPLAIVVGQPVNIDWGMTDIRGLAKHIAARHDGTLFVAWEHHYAEKLARQLLVNLGGKPSVVPVWNDADFDSLYVVRISDTGKGRSVSFAREQEGLDNLPKVCPN